MNSFFETVRDLHKKHPINTKQYAIYTPPMDRIIKIIGDWIDQQITGGYIFGFSRIGKSKCIRWFLKEVLSERFAVAIPLVVWIRSEGRRTEAEFWNALLYSTNFSFANPEKLIKKNEARFLFKQQLITLATRARGNYVVLLIDEAQGVTLAEWQWLLGLQNELDFEGFRLSILSVGSHQMSYQPDFIARTGNAHITARFFVRCERFHGIRNADELAFVLRGYDSDSEWPAKSGVSYLNFFSHENFERGCRLSNHAQMVWEAFVSQLPPTHAKNKFNFQPELPMLHVSQLVEKILMMLFDNNEWDDVLSPRNINNIIAESRFSAYMSMVSDGC